MSDTPRTEAFLEERMKDPNWKGSQQVADICDFACQLERENKDLRGDVNHLKLKLEQIGRIARKWLDTSLL